MSNKVEEKMKKPAVKRALVPKLRFPEFREAFEWEKKTLDDIAVFFKGKGISKSDIDSQGETSCIRYGELYTIYGEVIRTVSSKTKLPSSELFLSQKNDVLIPSSGETKIDISKASCVLLDDIALGGDLNVLRPNENGIFLSYLLNGVCKTKIAKKAQGDTVVHLYASQLKLLDVIVPKEPEQQKIADCLTSVDELVTLEAQKLDTLKAHKKGLMQQLFPAEGETLPKLRFPEFRDTDEWKRRRIGKVLIEQPRPISMGDEDEYSLVTVKRRYGGVVSRGIFKGKSIKVKTQFLLQENDFLISKRQIVHCACGVVPNALEGSIVSNEYSVLRVHDGFDISFFNYFSQQPEVSKSFLECSSGIVIEKMLFKLNDWLKKEFLFPSIAEQQKIAGTLYSIDELIATQSQKLDTLKAHKKGLMQQLFPALDEVQE